MSNNNSLFWILQDYLQLFFWLLPVSWWPAFEWIFSGYFFSGILFGLLVVAMVMILLSFAAQSLMEPHVKTIVLELLKIIRETENDDLTNVMQKLVCTYSEQMTPIAVEMTEHLVSEWVIESLCEGVHEWVIVWMSAWVSEWVHEWVSDRVQLI